MTLARPLVLLACAALAAACGDRPRPEPPAAKAPPADTAARLVDTAMAPAVGGEGGWSYWRTAVADLDGDGEAERIVATARVELYRGRPAWDDGQPWQVYVEEADGTRTYVYARFLQLATLEVRVARPEENRPATLVLIEHLPDRLGVYEVEYGGPGRAAAAVAFERALDGAGEMAGPALP